MGRHRSRPDQTLQPRHSAGRQSFMNEDDRQVRREKDRAVELTKTLRCKNVAVNGCSWVLALSLSGTASYSQVQSGQQTSPVDAAPLKDPVSNGSASDSGGSATPLTSQPPSSLAPGSS